MFIRTVRAGGHRMGVQIAESYRLAPDAMLDQAECHLAQLLVANLPA